MMAFKKGVTVYFTDEGKYEEFLKTTRYPEKQNLNLYWTILTIRMKTIRL
jgi:hypothetical protein